MVDKPQIFPNVKKKLRAIHGFTMFHKKLSTKYFFTEYYFLFLDLSKTRINWKLCPMWSPFTKIQS